MKIYLSDKLLHFFKQKALKKAIAQQISVAGAAGTSAVKEANSPATTQTHPVKEAKSAFFSGVFAKKNAQHGGMTSKAAASKTPVVLKAADTNSAVVIIKTNV